MNVCDRFKIAESFSENRHIRYILAETFQTKRFSTMLGKTIVRFIASFYRIGLSRLPNLSVRLKHSICKMQHQLCRKPTRKSHPPSRHRHDMREYNIVRGGCQVKFLGSTRAIENKSGVHAVHDMLCGLGLPVRFSVRRRRVERLSPVAFGYTIHSDLLWLLLPPFCAASGKWYEIG